MFNAATLGISPYRLNPHSIDQSGEDASEVNMSCAVSIISIACRSMLMKKCATFSRVSPHNSTNGKPNIICVGRTNLPRTWLKLTQMRVSHPESWHPNHGLVKSKWFLIPNLFLKGKLLWRPVLSCPDFISPTTEQKSPSESGDPEKSWLVEFFLHANWLLTVKQAFPRVFYPESGTEPLETIIWWNYTLW